VVEAATKAASAAMTTVGTAILASSFWIKILINYLFNFVKSLSTISHLLLMNVNFQGVTQVFFSNLMIFVQFDPIDLSDFYSETFELKNERPFNKNFEAIDYGT